MGRDDEGVERFQIEVMIGARWNLRGSSKLSREGARRVVRYLASRPRTEMQVDPQPPEL